MYTVPRNSTCPRRSMDRTLACGAGNVGSIPTGGTFRNFYEVQQQVIEQVTYYLGTNIYMMIGITIKESSEFVEIMTIKHRTTKIDIFV